MHRPTAGSRPLCGSRDTAGNHGPRHTGPVKADSSIEFPAAIARGKHPVPFRTRKLSPSAPMVLRGGPRGRVGRRRAYLKEAAPRKGRAASFLFTTGSRRSLPPHRGTAARRWPLRAAAALAQLLVETTPSVSATSPQPPRTAQAAWLELMKPAPVLATIEPVTATPMEMPNWRALAASAPAAPTWSAGRAGT